MKYRKVEDRYYCPDEDAGWDAYGVWHLDILYQIKLFNHWFTFWKHPVIW